MAAMSNYLENKLIDLVFRNTAFAGPATIYIALYTTSPSDASGGTEVSGNNYARASVASNTTNWAGTQAALSTAVSSGTTGTTSNNGTITFNVPSGSWGTVTHFALWDQSTGGNMLFWGALSASKLVQSGDAVTIQPSQLQIQIDD